MEARKKYEAEIIERVKLLPEEQLAKVISMLDKLKEEDKKKNYSEAIKKVWGFLDDGLSSSEEFAARKKEEKLLDR